MDSEDVAGDIREDFLAFADRHATETADADSGHLAHVGDTLTATVTEPKLNLGSGYITGTIRLVTASMDVTFSCQRITTTRSSVTFHGKWADDRIEVHLPDAGEAE